MPPSTPAAQRDPRLDFFRGIAMLIIFVAHVPQNPAFWYIPARFGFSDATEMFVFCSGFAAAIAFGSSYRRAGFGLGTARVLHRIWQVYCAHLGLFFAVAFISVTADALLNPGETIYVGKLNLYFFFERTTEAMLGLFTLTYVPNYFDIMPMYMVALALMPLMILLAYRHVGLVVAVSVGLWCAAFFAGASFPAELYQDPPYNEREWFFNPLGWQLLFFTGFALSIGWLPAPPWRGWLFALCMAFVLLSIPVCYAPIYREYEFLQSLREVLWPWRSKTDFGPLRYLHFLALAYIFSQLVSTRLDWLRGRLAQPILCVGQQSLPIFLFNMAFARIVGMGLDLAGRTPLTVWVANIGGMLIVVAVAYLLRWVKAAPWRVARPASAVAS